MDISKLPKLSETRKHEPGAAPRDAPQPHPSAVPIPTAQPVPARVEAPPGPEVFINVIIGLLLVYMGWPVFDYLIHRVTGRPFGHPVFDATGNPIEYTKSVFIWINGGVALFGLALIAYALLGRSRSGTMAWTVLLLLAVSGAVNVYAVIGSMNVIGLQILPVLCGAFAIYLSMYQWARVRLRHSA